MRHQDVGRLVLAVAFFVGAGANAVMLAVRPQVYEGFSDLAFLSFYKTLWGRAVLPNLGVWISLVVVFEVVVGVLLVAADPYARAGLILAAVYTVFLVPFWWGGGAVANILLLALMVWLLRFEYPASLIAAIFGR